MRGVRVSGSSRRFFFGSTTTVVELRDVYEDDTTVSIVLELYDVTTSFLKAAGSLEESSLTKLQTELTLASRMLLLLLSKYSQQ